MVLVLETDVHAVAGRTAFLHLHVLSDSDGQQAVSLIIQYFLIIPPPPPLSAFAMKAKMLFSDKVITTPVPIKRPVIEGRGKKSRPIWIIHLFI